MSSLREFNNLLTSDGGDPQEMIINLRCFQQPAWQSQQGCGFHAAAYSICLWLWGMHLLFFFSLSPSVGFSLQIICPLKHYVDQFNVGVRERRNPKRHAFIGITSESSLGKKILEVLFFKMNNVILNCQRWVLHGIRNKSAMMTMQQHWH